MIKRPNPLDGKGSYAAIVFKDSDVFVAQNNAGTIIAENVIASTVIQAALDYKPGKILCMDAEYEITSAISIPSNRTLEGESYKTIFTQPDPAISALIINDHVTETSNFQIKNLTLDGKSRGYDWTHGIHLQNISYFNIENVYGLDFTGTSAFGRNNLITIGSTNIANRLGRYGHIHNITADNVRGDIVFLTGKESQTAFSEYVNIYDVIAKGAYGNVIDVNEVRFCNIHNIIGENTTGADVLTDGAHFCNISNITSYESGCAVQLGHHAPATTGYSSFNTVSNVLCKHPTLHGIFILNSCDNVITNFIIHGSLETGAAVLVEAIGAGTEDEGVCTGNQLLNGLIIEPNQEGVSIFEATASDEASYTTLKNIRVTKTSGDAKHGFLIYPNHCTLAECVAKGSSINNGFFMYGSSNSTISNCTAISCAGYGVQGASADYLMLIADHLTGNTTGSTNGLGANSKAPVGSNFL